ncbi:MULTISPECIES: hypothetical protein [unclassified Flavobacterium]|uniref:hypothetical protein n=1 Tax=unclassified Flavobacterium TaxID=196869 RepID=UPI003F905634
MKKISLLLFLLVSFKGFSCDCDSGNNALEFYSSKYVFEGKIISKVYAADSLTYKITFDILKHYKNGDAPKTLSFDLKSEAKYSKQWSSCDWMAKKNEKWIVYAYENNGKINFSGICSNSRVLDSYPIQPNEQKMLDNGNSFKIEDFIYEYEYDFNFCKNITDINSILEKGKVKDYLKPFTILSLHIDSEGNLKSVNITRELLPIYDSINHLRKELIFKSYLPVTEFEKDAIELISQVKKWEIKKHKQTKVNVAYLKNISVEYDLKTNKWNYELW